MCIVAIAWQVLPNLPLCLISNRDENYQRPTAALAAWSNSPIIAGRDLAAGGTWMGITATGRWAVLTNIRDGRDQKNYASSRGELVEQFLNSSQRPIRFAQALQHKQCDYAGFNLIVGDQEQAVYLSNRGEAPQVLAKGVYVMGNGLLHEDWAKNCHLRKRFTQELLPLLQLSSDQQMAYDIDYAVWDILQDQRQLPDEALPNTYVDRQLERLLSSIFIQSEDYGTRCSNFLVLNQQHWHWQEKTQYGEHKDNIATVCVALSEKNADRGQHF